MPATNALRMPPESRVDDRPYSDDVLSAVDSGRTIDAIKRLREETGLGLKEAKDEIDALARERQGNAAVASGMTEEGGAGSMVKIIVFIAVVLAAYFFFFAP